MATLLYFYKIKVKKGKLINDLRHCFYINIHGNLEYSIRILKIDIKIVIFQCIRIK